MTGRDHWDHIYETKRPTEVSWYRAHLDTSLELIEQAAPNRSSPIIDVGAGEATLVDDLLRRGYTDMTVLDISNTASQASARVSEMPPRASSGSAGT
jgi:hypothetical protein